MGIDVTSIKWSNYGGYEGPVYYGTKSFAVPPNPTFLQKCMAVVGSVEGHVDAVNMYDSGIVSLGTVQWIERGNMSVSDMMGAVAERCGIEYVNQALKYGLNQSSSSFRKNSAGKWRFFMKKDGVEVEVSTPDLQREHFLGCSGKKGDWTPSSTQHAKIWCASFVSVWASDEACRAQLEFSSKRLLPWFVTPNAKKLLFVDPEEIGWKGALKAIFVSFAVNVPAVADRQLVVAVQSSKFEKFSREWCLDVVHQLVFGSGIAIWPVRYAGLVKRIKQLFNIDLPASPKELAKKEWQVPVPAVLAPVVPAPAPVVVEQPPIPVPVVDTSESEPETVTVGPQPSPSADISATKLGTIMLLAGGVLMFLTNVLQSCGE